MGVLVACNNEEDPIKNEAAIAITTLFIIKNEAAREVTTLFIDFLDAQGQLTPKSVLESCQNLNSSKLLWLVLLPARMKKNHLKMKAKEWS